MAIVSVKNVGVPKRWDLPFSQDFPDAIAQEKRDLLDSELDEILCKLPFASMEADNFPKAMPLRDILRNDARVRLFRKGDVVVRQGDFGNSAFLILKGACSAIVEGLPPTEFSQQETQSTSIWRSLKGIFFASQSPEVRDTSTYPSHKSSQEAEGPSPSGRVFVQDVPNVIELTPDAFADAHLNVMPEGSLFGELSSLGRFPRAVTVVADDEEETQLLEIRWQGLRELMRYDSALREHVDTLFRSHSLENALRSCPFLEGATLAPSDWDELIALSEFETIGTFDWYGSFKELRRDDHNPLEAEPVVAEFGEYVNGLLIVRGGFGRLSRPKGSGESTVGYVGKGDVFGLRELMANCERHEQMPLQMTLRAVGYLDVVRIPSRVFERAIYPNIDKRDVPTAIGRMFQKQSEESSLRNIDDQLMIATDSPAVDVAADEGMMEFLVSNRFVNGTSAMMIDLDRCTRCDDCVRACASGHDNNPRFVRHGEIHDHFMVPNACMHCADPVCMIGCPTGAISRSEEHGEVVINDRTCIGCGTCANSCPYNNIRLVEVRDRGAGEAVIVDPMKGRPIVKATKCDLCINHPGGPACERACPHDALSRIDMGEIQELEHWLNR